MEDEQKLNQLTETVSKLKPYEEKKEVDEMPVELAFNARYVEPYEYWWYVNIGHGWGYTANFGTDYGKAKAFYDNIDWFAKMIVANNKTKQQFEEQQQITWNVIVTLVNKGIMKNAK